MVERSALRLGQRPQTAPDTRSSDDKGNNNHSSQSPLPPPPPYADDHYGPPGVLVAATTTTQVVTTTHTTTHFLSMPLWRRKAVPLSSTSSARPSIEAHSADEMGHITPTISTPSGSWKVNKDLPPTPPQGVMDISGPFSRETIAQPIPLPRPSHDPPSRSSTTWYDRGISSSPTAVNVTPPSPHTPEAAHALARAALGLGLPHVMPQQQPFVPVSTSLESTTGVANAPGPSNVRRAKSFHKSALPTHSAQSETVGPPAVSANTLRRRTRGLSLGPWQLGLIDSKSKPKDENADVVQPVQGVSRKSSFFGRKRNDSTKGPAKGSVSVPPSPALQQASYPMPSLPQVPVTSPFAMDTRGLSSPGPSQLRRHNSERRFSQQSMGMLSFMQSSSPRTSPPASPYVPPPAPAPAPVEPAPERSIWRRRPQTAEANAERSRVQSMFTERPTTAPSPSGAPPPPIFTRSALLPTLTTSSTRRRSQTNPLHPSDFPPSPSFHGGVMTGSPLPSPRVSYNKPSMEALKPHEEESPEIYIQRLLEVVSRAEIGGILASSADEFRASALRAYIGRFMFHNDPLDIAIRKLLMDVGLPRETQQIDRVMEAFAARYVECNPNLFASDDQAYILAFSLIMLHTDAFNKSNKRKMSKADYVKNTRLPGVPPEVLEYFFDNVVFAPFIFIEESEDADGYLSMPSAPTRASTYGPPSISVNTTITPGGSVMLARGPKIDPYFLIIRNMLDPFRVPTENYVQWETPYSFLGTGNSWDDEEVRQAFTSATVIEVAKSVERMPPTGFFSLPVSGTVGTPLIAASSLHTATGALPEPSAVTRKDNWTLKVTKIGVLVRKDDTIEGGKRAPNRKWREWTVILTGSQLLFFRDPTWAETFLRQDEGAETPSSLLRPDELLAVKDAVAVFDASYTKYPNCMHFIMSSGRHILLRAQNEVQLNQWIACINYASAFKTAGIRIRPSGMSQQDIELTGIAAATSHLKATQQPQKLSPLAVRRWDNGSGSELSETSTKQLLLSPGPSTSGSSDAKPRSSFERILGSKTPAKVDMEAVLPPPIESGAEFKAIFDQTKHDLAARKSPRPAPRRTDSVATDHSMQSSIQIPTSPTGHEHNIYPSRSSLVRGKINDLTSRLATAQSQLDADMRIVRNIAILTPFQQATRERLHAAVQVAARRIMLVRLEIAKLACHRQVLEDDLKHARREWRQTKAIALRAAINAIDSTTTPSIDVELVPPAQKALEEIETYAVSSPVAIPRPLKEEGDADMEHRTSSRTASFYSAADFGPEWTTAPITDDEPPAGAPSPDHDDHLDSAVEEPSSGYPFPTVPASSLRSHISGLPNHERYYTAVEGEAHAEDWNLTQAARRVSLVQVPSEIHISSVWRHANNIASQQDPSPTSRSPGRPIRQRSIADGV